MLRRVLDPAKWEVETVSVEKLSAALVGSQGVSGDWENEIHPTSKGYKKLAKVWEKKLKTIIP